jgi:hypothetical protein
MSKVVTEPRRGHRNPSKKWGRRLRKGEYALDDHGADQAARPTADYDTRYGATTGPWTTDKFVEAMFRDLSRRK